MSERLTRDWDDDRPDPAFRQSATLAGVLSRLHRDADDPELRARLDAAFSKHHVALRARVRRELRGHSEELVEDTVQEVLLVAWSKLADHDGRHFKAWLLAIAGRVCANVRRKRRDQLSDDGLFDPGSEAESVYAVLRREERERLFLEAARRVLDARDQEVVYLRYELELPAEEIARAAKLDEVDEVRVILQRSKRRLAKELARVMEERGHGRSLFQVDDEG